MGMGPTRHRFRLFAAGAALAFPLLAGGCATLPQPRTLSCAQAPEPAVTLSSDGRTAHARIEVMTYNLEGLGWPVRKGREAELAEIGQRLAAMREAGDAPHVIVFQEMFSDAAVDAVRAAGYPARVAGPSQFKRRDMPSKGRVPGPRRWKKGELGVRLAGGGLAIVSEYPILAHKSEPFSHHACAGFDCFSNKGALYAELAIPGAPEPLRIFDSHMNSKHRSGTSTTRTLVSHEVQSQELADFVAARGDAGGPTVLAGDFNMRHSPARFAAFEAVQPLTLVQHYCLETGAGCDVRVAWTGATPWLDTEDLQFFRSGQTMTVRPVRVRTLFAGGPDDPMLSDHKAVRVTYDLSWPVDAAPTANTCPAATPIPNRRLRTIAALNAAGPAGR
ncbi:MAG: metal-dependent hydrolase [Phenylobacterium sp.]|nr:metal-dependent hydrolase [Phenylobacterium sp.]